MNLMVVSGYYIVWHYTAAFRDMAGVWMNFFWFLYNFFSISTLFRSLFSPWRRLDEERKGGFDPAAFGEALIVNTIMRFVGFCIRLVTILLGCVALAALAVLGILFVIFWIFLPALIVGLFVIGIAKLIA